ncbi:MAG: DsbA family protein [Actinomycetota bacterium]
MGLDRSALLRDLGVTVVSLPLEIHPEIPVGGLTLADRWASRYGEALEMYERIETACRAAGMAFHRPARVPNTRRALETAEWVRVNEPHLFLPVERGLFEAHFVDNRPLDDPEVVDAVLVDCGAGAAAARQAVEAGEMQAPLAAAATLAGEVGVTGTPAWLVARQILVPGALPPGVFRQVVSQVQSS